MYTICKRFTFEASHQLINLPEGHPCMNLHGHSYKVDIYLKNKKLNAYGFVVDFHHLKSFKKYLDDNFDHTGDILNQTAEQLAESFYIKLQKLFPGIVSKVRVWETEKCWAEYEE